MMAVIEPQFQRDFIFLIRECNLSSFVFRLFHIPGAFFYAKIYIIRFPSAMLDSNYLNITLTLPKLSVPKYILYTMKYDYVVNPVVSSHIQFWPNV